MKNLFPKILFALCVAVFAFFPLTDSDIWWHLAAARDFFSNGLSHVDPFCSTPSRTPWINVHLFFEVFVHFIFAHFGALGLVVLKAFLWGVVAFLWVLPVRRPLRLVEFSLAVAFAFLMRYAFECRPVFLSMLFLGLFWNLLPELEKKRSVRFGLSAVFLLGLEWLWVRSQGLFPLGFALSFFALAFSFERLPRKRKIRNGVWFLLLLSVPLWHVDGPRLFLYPFGLLDRLLGGSSAAKIFSREIAENRSPLSLMLSGESELLTAGLFFAVILSLILLLRNKNSECLFRKAWIFVVAFLAVVAERNICLFVFPFAFLLFEVSPISEFCSKRRIPGSVLAVLLLAFTLGTFARSVPAYFRDGNFTSVAAERVPTGAVSFMKSRPMAQGKRLFNDDRSGGYLEWTLPGIKPFADGRFILKDSAFFASYLGYAQKPESFLSAADSLSIGRVLLPVRYFPLWHPLALSLQKNFDWETVYADSLYAVFDRRRNNF